MLRAVTPELLDELPPDDPRAVHSRRDLTRVNRVMGNANIMARALRDTNAPESAPLVVVELGGGDGTFLLELARRVAPRIGAAVVTLVDQQSLVTRATRDQLEACGWKVETVAADVFDWLEHGETRVADVTLANLFLHHFDGERLTRLLRGAAARTRRFVACEPHRSGAALAAASLVGLIGCNSVTVHDARASVRAGFRGRELSNIWPAAQNWSIEERKAGPFTHGFVAYTTVPTQSTRS